MKTKGFWKGASLALALLFAAGVGNAALAAAQQTKAQAPAYNCSIKVPQPEPRDLSTLAKIKADQAMSAAQAAFPGAQVKKVELDNENGCLVYSVDLSNGMDVKVDAGNGSVLYHEKADKEGHEGREGKDEED
jgi:uncharacterized membrane protein YkoI